MGRPPLPLGKAKEVQIGLRADSELAETIAEDSAKSGETQAEWVRGAAKDKALTPPVWVKSKWTCEDLSDQLIAFCLRSKVEKGIRVLEGVGRLKVRENNYGEIAVDIFVDEATGPFSGVLTRIWLSKEAVDRIEINPKPPAKYRLLT